jgi:excisionase family DNA binding protein
MTEQQAADYLGLRPNTLAHWRACGTWGLKFVRVGRQIRYRESDLAEWLASRAQEPAKSK